jgi:hypothetical protein
MADRQAYTAVEDNKLRFWQSLCIEVSLFTMMGFDTDIHSSEWPRPQMPRKIKGASREIFLPFPLPVLKPINSLERKFTSISEIISKLEQSL